MPQALAGVRALLFRQKNNNLNYLVSQTTKEKKQHMSMVFLILHEMMDVNQTIGKSSHYAGCLKPTQCCMSITSQ